MEKNVPLVPVNRCVHIIIYPQSIQPWRSWSTEHDVIQPRATRIKVSAQLLHYYPRWPISSVREWQMVNITLHSYNLPIDNLSSHFVEAVAISWLELHAWEINRTEYLLHRGIEAVYELCMYTRPLGVTWIILISYNQSSASQNRPTPCRTALRASRLTSVLEIIILQICCKRSLEAVVIRLGFFSSGWCFSKGVKVLDLPPVDLLFRSRVASQMKGGNFSANFRCFIILTEIKTPPLLSIRGSRYVMIV